MSIALSAHLLIVSSYNFVQLSAEELVEKSPFEEFKEKELDQQLNFILCFIIENQPITDISLSAISLFDDSVYVGILREIPIPPPDFGFFFS